MSLDKNPVLCKCKEVLILLLERSEECDPVRWTYQVSEPESCKVSLCNKAKWKFKWAANLPGASPSTWPPFLLEEKSLKITHVSSLFSVSEVTATLHIIVNSSCEHIPHLQVNHLTGLNYETTKE